MSHSSRVSKRIGVEPILSVTMVYRRFNAFLRFSPPPPGAAPRLTAFAGLILAPELSAAETFESAVPNGEGDT